MKTYTFRVTQSLEGFYEGKIDIEANSEKEAREKLEEMSNKKLDDLVYNWEQNTDNAEPFGDIEIQECKNIS